MNRLLLFAVLLAVGLVLSHRPAAAQVPEFGDFTVLRAGESVGQTLVAPQAGLSGIAFLLKFDRPGDGEIYLRLRHDPTDTDDLAVGRLPLSAIGDPGFYRIDFAPQPDSQGQPYFALLEFVGSGQVALAKRPGDSYLDGALYREDGPKNAQAEFQLHYAAQFWLPGLLQQLGQLLVVVLAGLALFVLPGWALLALLLPGHWLRWPERLGLAAGLSVALYPLLLVWTSVASLRLGALHVWLPLLLSCAALLWLRAGRKWQVTAFRLQLSGATEPGHCEASGLRDANPPGRVGRKLLDGVFIVLLVILFGSRLWMTQGLTVPMWGDSLQHAMIAQLLLDNGGLFTSWEPYTPYGSLSVQFGFSAAVAAFSWLTGIASAPATVLVGQLFSALAALTIYPLALRVAGGSPWAGLGALLIAGLLSPLPAAYLNWGRYAQLAGQVVLPVALWLLWEVLQADDRPWRRLVLAALAAAGMALSYYRMPFYYATFVPALLLCWALPQLGPALRAWLRLALRLALLGVLTAALLLPWALRVSSGGLDDAVRKGVAVAPLAERVLADYAFWLYVGDYLPWTLLAPALLALALSLVGRRWTVAMVGVWVLLLASLVAGRFFRLPGAALMQNFAIIISLYIPAALLGGWLLAVVAAAFERKKLRLSPVLAGGLLVLALLGAWRQQVIPDRVRHALVTRPDELALVWVRANTPANARFLVQSYRINNGTSVVGGDAGWWLPLLGGRQNTLPPQYALLNERPLQPGYSQQVVDLVAALEGIPAQSDAGLQLLCNHGITHVYSGQRRSLVGEQARPLFAPDALAQSEAFTLIYRRDRVAIYALDTARCRQ